MKSIIRAAKKYIRRSDMLLLGLCLACTVFGIVLIASATKVYHTRQYVLIQSAATVIGIGLYFVFSLIDLDSIASKWKLLFAFSVLFIMSLQVLGVADNTGNRAWIRFAGIGIQPAEVVKIPFTILLAKLMCHLKDTRGLSNIWSVPQLVGLFGLFAGLIVIISADMGSALVYASIFIVMLWVGGLKLYWFLIGGGVIAAAFPIVWNNFFTERYRMRILAPYDPSIDPEGLDIKYQVKQSLAAMSHGGLTGSGLFHGPSTQSGATFAQHTDFIFAVVAEELGFLGCLLVVALLAGIIIRCIYVGVQSKSEMGLLVCTGLAAMLIFQTLENIGMCIGLTPVIGLTLPFFSYGGSSIITLFAAMGIVSGIRYRSKSRGYYY
ncbi:MAG: FtsW/RodA/SpoVE family cell cycle protein [Oscillospiraceae bacterium]|nr:FtsW/RodA/SpoVE family cell cycle protein [Oscillospiraceae bacterium]